MPYGTNIAVPVEDVHYDESIYPNARHFDPFRFTKPNGAAADGKGYKSAVTLDDHFLGFGTGRHGCPGRFFAVHEMKLMVAQMLLNYDVDYVKVKPDLIDIIWLKVPLNNAKVRVRRRAGCDDDVAE